MTEAPDKFWAGGFLYNPENNKVFLHKRDGNTKFNPNKWAFFGGLNEPGETPIECFVRELEEEIGLSAKSTDVIHLCEYMNVEFSTYRIVFYLIAHISEEQLVLGEGAGFGWVPLDEIDQYDLTDKTLIDIEYFINMNNLHSK
jgi:8-oxo-dGTP diphosphatase